MFNELVIANTTTANNDETNITTYHVLFTSFLFLIIIMLLFEVMVLNQNIKGLEEKIKSNYSIMTNAHNDNTMVCKKSLEKLEEKLEEKFQEKLQEKYTKIKDAHNGNVQILTELSDELEEKVLENTQIIKEIQDQLKKIEEHQTNEEKKYKMQLQKVSQENIKSTQHISVLFDRTKTMQKHIDILFQEINKIDNDFIAIGVLNEQQQPFYVHKSNKTELHNDGWMHSNVNYLVLSKLIKTKVKKMDIYILFNVAFKIYDNDTYVKVTDINIPAQLNALQKAHRFLKEQMIEIIMPNPNDTNIIRILNGA